MFACCALPILSFVACIVVALPQTAYVEESRCVSKLVSFIESSQGIQCTKAADRGSSFVLYTVTIAGCRPK